MTNQQFPFQFVQVGNVTSFSGAGVSASFETQKDQIQAELGKLTLQQAQQGIQFANSFTTGVTQISPISKLSCH